MKKHIGLNFNFTFQSIDKKTGKVKKEAKFHNLVTNAGLNAVAGLIAAEFDYLAIGTGTTAANATDTALETEFTRENVIATSEGTGVIEYDHVFEVGTGVSEEITEVGLFNSATETGSTMLNRAVDTAFTLDEDNPLRVVGTITVSTT